MQTCYANISLRGIDLDPEAITTATGLAATFAVKRGQAIQGKPGRPAPEGRWVCKSTAQVQGDSPAEHIRWCIDAIARAGGLPALQSWGVEQAAIDLFVVSEHDASDLAFSNALIHAIARTGFELKLTSVQSRR